MPIQCRFPLSQFHLDQYPFGFGQDQIIFHMSVEVSDQIHKIQGPMETAVDEAREHYIVQVVTDNGTNTNDKQLMNTQVYFFGTTCVAHFIDLMEDIGDTPLVLEQWQGHGASLFFKKIFIANHMSI